MAIEWTPDLAVGDPTIDAQHQELFRRIDSLLEAMHRGEGKTEVLKLLDYLGTYVVEHFGAEQRAMVAIGDLGYASHKAEHDGFVADYQALRASYQENGANTALVIEINRRVCAWLRIHIARTDKKLGKLLRERGRTS